MRRLARAWYAIPADLRPTFIADAWRQLAADCRTLPADLRAAWRQAYGRGPAGIR